MATLREEQQRGHVAGRDHEGAGAGKASPEATQREHSKDAGFGVKWSPSRMWGRGVMWLTCVLKANAGPVWRAA